jgi:hypothetical protein
MAGNHTVAGNHILWLVVTSYAMLFCAYEIIFSPYVLLHILFRR